HDEESHPPAPRLPPHQHQRHHEREERQEIRDRRHHGSRNTALTDSTPSANEPAKSSGTRKSRSLAMAVSRSARAPASTTSLPPRARRPSTIAGGVTSAGAPDGQNKFASRAGKSRGFVAAAPSPRARRLAEASNHLAA